MLGVLEGCVNLDLFQFSIMRDTPLGSQLIRCGCMENLVWGDLWRKDGSEYISRAIWKDTYPNHNDPS